MEVERAGPHLSGRRSMAPPAKQITPSNARKTVSAASVFKQRNRKQIDITSQANLNMPQPSMEDAPAAKSLSVKSRSSSRSLPKADWRISRKGSKMHPIAAAFKDTSNDYRRHLYKSTTLKITKTLEALLNSLYESTLQDISPDNSQQDLMASPLKLSVPAKYERMALKLHQPLSQYRLGLYRTNTQGERERFQATLETRMQHYQEHLAKRTEEIASLQKQWETVVGEIWKLGVSCLGESVMQSLLFPSHGALGFSSSPSKATEAESTLFVPEQGSSPPLRKTRTSKKRVTFEASDLHDGYNAASTLQFPEFLHQPSRYRNYPLPTVPAIPEREIENLEAEVKQLGHAQIDELRKIEKEHQEFWKRKTKQLASALETD